MTSARIEINKDRAILQSSQECIKVKARKNLRLGISIEFLAVASLNLSLHKKGIVKFRAHVVREVVKTPIRLWVELAKPCALLYRRQPKLMPRINGKGIKGDQYLSCLTVNHNTEASIIRSFALMVWR